MNNNIKQFTTVYHESLGVGYVIRVNNKNIVYCQFSNNAVSFISLEDLLHGDMHIALSPIERKPKDDKEELRQVLTDLFEGIGGWHEIKALFYRFYFVGITL